MSDDADARVVALALVGGVVFGVGLAASRMARPEVVLDFLQFEDFGLLLVMAAGTVVAGIVFRVASRSGRRAPLTGRAYSLRVRDLDREVVAGGVVFGVGWGVSGVCPGAAYASVGIGNAPILFAIAGMFLQVYWRDSRARSATGAGAEVAGD